MKKTRILKTITAVLLMMVFAVGCNKPDEPNNGGNNGNNDNDVRVTTYSPQDITATTAKCGGDVIVTQGLSLSELGICWGKEQNPTAEQNHLSTSIWNEPFVCTITDLEPDTKYYVRAYALRGLEYYYGEEKSFSTTEDNGIGVYNGHKYVDLGLPSGTLWAICNIGANTPEDYGGYYAWGETTTKALYSWDTYIFGNGENSVLTKYCSTDNLTILLPEDDAASTNWGDGWCIPTDIQWNELKENTSYRWATQNGVDGGLFTASNGHSLFLPAAGSRANDNSSAGFCGFYWSNTLFSVSHRAWRFYLDSNSCGAGPSIRYVGGSIRPVHSSK